MGRTVSRTPESVTLPRTRHSLQLPPRGHRRLSECLVNDRFRAHAPPSTRRTSRSTLTRSSITSQHGGVMRFIVGGRSVDLTRDQVEESMRGVRPDPIRKHVVEMLNSVFPPKQVFEK